MKHLDDDEVVAAAVGGLDDDVARGHLQTCSDCEVRVAGSRRTVAALRRSGEESLPLEQPSAHVRAAVLEAVRPPLPGPVLDDAHTPLRAVPSEVSHRAPARRPRRLVAASVGFLVGVAATVAGVLVVGRDDPAPQAAPTAQRTATGVLRTLDQTSHRGAVSVVDGPGGRRLKVQMDDDDANASNFVQAWLLDPRTNEMVSLGVMEKRDESFAIPANLDLSVFDYVDISLEPYDGNPAHSSTSLARGRLTPTST